MGHDYESERAHPPSFENRKCRDVFWLLLFTLFIGGMFVIVGFAVSKGNYRRVVNGIDVNGCTCGTTVKYDAAADTCTEDAAGVTLGSKSVFVKFLSDATYGDNIVVLCASACPTINGQLYCVNTDNSVFLGVGDDLVAQSNYVRAQKCGGSASCSYLTNNCAVSYASNSVFGYCLPTHNVTFVEAANAVMGNRAASTAVSSIEKAAWIIVLSVAASIILSLIYIKLLEYCAKPLTFLGIVVIAGCMVAAGIFLITAANHIAESYTGASADAYKQDFQWQMNFYGGIAVLVVAGLYIVMVVCMCRSILLALDAVELASEAVRSNTSLVFFPIFLAAIVVGTFAAWCAVSVLLFSAADITPVTSHGASGVIRKFTFDRQLQYVGIYHLFGLFWSTQFVIAIGELTIAYTIARWFFSDIVNGSRNVPTFPVLHAFRMAVTKHAGSAALGSLLIAIIKMLRAALEYVEQRTKRATGESRLVACAFCCCRCYLWCLEKCMRFINNQAYIQIALTGDSFCESARRAFGLILRHLGDIGSLKIIATAFVFLGKLLIMAASSVLCYAILTQAPTYADLTRATAVPNPFIPCLLVAFVTYWIGSLFLDVYGHTVEVILMCFIHDKEATGGRYSDAHLSGKIADLNASAAKQHPVVTGTTPNYT